jgi:hypothetical protein
MEIMKLLDKMSDGKYIFYCPGCGCNHWFTIPRWTFNNNFDAPTVAPSIILSPQDLSSRCHLRIVSGKIEYLTDSFHFLAGIIIDMIDLEEMEEKLK